MKWLRTAEFAEASLVDLASQVAIDGVLRLRGTPLAPHTVVQSLSALGEPVEYYGDNAGTHPQHSAIWRVRYEREASSRGEAHALAGPLPVHSSLSLLSRRPPYFVMLMVNGGWQDNEPGFNGESLLAPWVEAIALMADSVDSWDDVRAILTGPVLYPDGEHRPLMYQLPGSSNEYDMGVRFKSGMAEYLRDVLGSTHPMTEAVATLVWSAKQVARRVQLDAGDLVVLDNNRWGHGRLSVMGVREGGALNPRELWSFTLA